MPCAHAGRHHENAGLHTGEDSVRSLLGSPLTAPSRESAYNEYPKGYYRPVSISLESLVCGLRGHVTPASTVATLSQDEAGLGIDVHPTWRFSRCLRCDAWIGGPPPVAPDRERLASVADMDLPRRGKALRQAVVLRLIAVERSIHCLVFALVAVLGLLLRIHLAGAQSAVQRGLDTLARGEAQTGAPNNNNILVHEGTKFLHLSGSTLDLLIVTAAIYAVIEGTETVGLWLEKRWAEYLTALATAGFLPLEIYELLGKVTVFRLGALVVNLAIVAYLIYAKHLFGLGGKRAESAESDPMGDGGIFSPPY